MFVFILSESVYCNTISLLLACYYHVWQTILPGIYAWFEHLKLSCLPSVCFTVKRTQNYQSNITTMRELRNDRWVANGPIKFRFILGSVIHLNFGRISYFHTLNLLYFIYVKAYDTFKYKLASTAGNRSHTYHYQNGLLWGFDSCTFE